MVSRYKPSPWQSAGSVSQERCPDNPGIYTTRCPVGLGYTCAEVGTFRGIRSAVMKRAWDEVRSRERQGIPVTLDDFGGILSAEWDKAKVTLATCPRGQWFAGLP